VSSIVFKEWLPDQPELGNGGLIRAENVLPRDDGYAPYRGLDTAGGTIGSAVLALDAFMASGVTKGAIRVYAYADQYYSGAYNGTFSAHGAASTASPGNVAFAQYENFVISVSEAQPAQHHTIGSTGNFSTLASSGTAPPAQAIGIIGQFVMIGGLGTAGSSTQTLSNVQWSGVDQPRSWPTPNSSTAIAQQAGEQTLPMSFGEVQAIHGGDQHGVILQKSGVTRATYVGPPVVFQFDTISNTEGCFFTRGHLRVGNISYFVSRQGFCRTNGVDIEHIGAGKVDREFWDSVNVSGSNPVQIGYDWKNDLVLFAYATTSSSSMDRILVFNPKSGNWTRANQTMLAMIGGSPPLSTLPMLGVHTSGGNSRIGQFAATAGTAVLETGEMEITEAGRTYIDGLKPNVESSGTAPAISCRIGYRDSLDTAPSYTSTTSAFARTGVANFRVDAKYHRFETQIVGNFEKVTGIEFDSDPSGYA
jgi:hypothetical protein